LWQTHRLERLAGHPPGETITREIALAATQQATAVPAPAPPATLPHLSLAFPPGEGAPATPPPGTVPDLVVTAVLGEGGMGRVLLAQQRSLAREVAVKVVRPGASSRLVESALLAEGMVTGALEHPNVIPVHALGVDDTGQPVLVMKRVEGVSWRELVHDDRHPFWAKRGVAVEDRAAYHLDVLMSLCDALQLAHARGYIHRDVKPENVMLGDFGEVYLVDWGVACRKLDAASGAHGPFGVVGSPAYMAPEMVGDDPAAIDERTDVYLLGATLFEVLTGQPRHPGDSLHQVLLAAYVSAPPVFTRDVSVPEELTDLVERATHRDPARRPASVLAFRTEIGEFRRHRASRSLASQSAARLEELAALLGGERNAAVKRKAYELFVECRFGFAQALREWSGNEAARAGMQTCLAAMIGLEIDQENLEAARALLAQLPEPDADLARRAAALEGRLAERKQHHERLAKIEREHDVGVSARARALGFTAFALVVSAIGGYFGFGMRARPTHAELVVIASSVAALGFATVLVGRRVFLRNEVNRRLSGTFLLTLVAFLVHRLVGLRFDVPVPAILTGDLVLLAVAFAVMALSALRWAWWSAALVVLGLALMAAMPEHAVTVFSAVSALAVGLAALNAYRIRDVT
jgi:serine/threonine-protein kinase